MKKQMTLKACLLGAGMTLCLSGAMATGARSAQAAPLDPLAIPKYVTPMVIPPALPTSSVQPGAPAADYNIAVREFQQQILPSQFPPTTVWSYGLAEDAVPAVAPSPNSTFNYPAFTVEAQSNSFTSVRWINDLVNADGTYKQHLLPIDQNIHWANPPMDCKDGVPRTDCVGQSALPYDGPVPIVTHLHGAHVNGESDGYPEAWWLPAANNIPAGYATGGTLFDQYDRSNTVPGSAFYGYENDQPATTLWYHDHSLGITRVNVYAGPAGFWLIRGGANGAEQALDATTMAAAVLPGPAPAAISPATDPNFNAAYRSTIREVPVVIQDRSFNDDGSLFYPGNRAFFEGLNDPVNAPNQFPGAGDLDIPYAPDANSDINPIWNPEAFFDTMVVNGNTWPFYDVAPARYRLRLLNGCNSRFLNLAMHVVNADGTLGAEVPFYQIGGDQGFLPNVVKVETGSYTVYDGTPGGALVPAPSAVQGMLLAPAERADVIVDFSALSAYPEGTRIRMINTAPDAPFGGFPDAPANPATTGQVMEFVLNPGLFQPSDSLTTAPQNLLLPAENDLGLADNTRQLSLNEEESAAVCWECTQFDAVTGECIGDMVYAGPPPCIAPAELAAPKAALLGTVTAGTSTPLLWMEDITETPLRGDTETWEILNLTADAHPIHLHLVRFQIVDRQPLATDQLGEAVPSIDLLAPADPPLLPEQGYKDTVIAYPGQATRIKALFDRAGLYVWHCHILEHEDNEMMRPYVVRHTPDIDNNSCVDRNDLTALLAVVRDRTPTVANLAFDLNDDGAVNIVDARYLVANFTNPRGSFCP